MKDTYDEFIDDQPPIGVLTDEARESLRLAMATPMDIEGPGRTREQMAEDARELNRIAPTPAEKFALMFGAATGVEARVCEDIAARQRLGIAKYGCTVEASKDDMLQHAYEESLDLCIYLKAEIERRISHEQAPQ